MQNDHDLIKEYQNGNISAYDQLIKNHLSNTVGFFFNITGDRMVAEDLAQDVFFKLYTHHKKFRFESKFSTYLYRVKLNAANSWLKRNKWKNILHLDQAPDKGERDTELEQEWTRKELKRHLYRAVANVYILEGIAFMSLLLAPLHLVNSNSWKGQQKLSPLLLVMRTNTLPLRRIY